jgi:hypothetical protein
MVLCDEIRRASSNPDTFDLFGVRTEIKASIFPHTHPLLYVYMQVSGRQGVAACRLEVQQSDTDATVYQSSEK